jgi:hypothetical protein
VTDAAQARDLERIGVKAYLDFSNSYRNIMRAGFEERHVVENWIRRRGSG